MSSWSPKAAAILARVRAERGLAASAEDRLSSQLLQRVARGVEPLPGIDASPVHVPESAWLPRSLGPASSRWIISTLAGAVIVGAVVGLRLLPQTPRAESPRAAAVVRDPPATTADAAAVSVDAKAEVVEPRAELPPRAAQLPRVRTRRSAESRRPRNAEATGGSAAPASIELAQSPPRPAAVTTLEAELQLLREAYQELNAGRAPRALAVLDEHAARFPQGELAQARELASMLALRAAGRSSEACLRARRFLLAHPASPFRAKVQAICPAG